MKKLFNLTLLALLAASSLVNAQGKVVDKIDKKNTTFELFNKDEQDIRISVFKVAGGTIVQTTFDDNTVISPREVARAEITVENLEDFLIYFAVEIGMARYKFTLRPGTKTAYVSFSTDRDPEVYPQTGRAKGVMKTTNSGLSLRNNIKVNEIKEGDTRSMIETADSALRNSKYYDFRPKKGE